MLVSGITRGLLRKHFVKQHTAAAFFHLNFIKEIGILRKKSAPSNSKFKCSKNNLIRLNCSQSDQLRDRNIKPLAILWNGYSLFVSTVKQYGKLALGLHVTVFFSTFTGFYFALRNGLEGDCVLMFLHDYLPMLKEIDIHPEWGLLGLAYAMTALSGPFRYLITIFGTPRLYKYLGYSKPAQKRSV